MNRNRAASCVAAAVVLGLVSPACGGDRSEEDAATKPTVIDATTTTTATSAARPVISATEHSFTVPAEIKGGVTTIEFKNTGAESHAFDLVRLDPGKTLADVKEALKSFGAAPPPPCVHFAGGTALAPGASRTYTAVLEPGAHAVFDPLFSPDGQRHFMKGQVSLFTVTPGDAGAALPGADVTVKSIDHRFEGLDGLRSGQSTVRFENAGREPHELLLFEMAPGRTGQGMLEDVSITT